jgi:general secretion pathway protein L
MSERLLIRLAPDGRLSWLAQGADHGALSGAVAGAPPAAELERQRPVIVLVPAEDVLLLEAPAISRLRAQLARAVPFALEEQLVQPVEELHFALAPQAQDGRIGVAVVARATVQRWLQQLESAGVLADVLVPESLLLPKASVLVEPDRATLRLDAWRSTTTDTAGLVDWLSLFASEFPAGLAVFDARDAARLALPLPVTEYHGRLRDALAALSVCFRGEPELNLLQGDFAPRHRAAPAQRLWRVAGLFAAAAVVLGLGYGLVERSLLQRESERLDDAMHAQLVQSFPDMEKVAGEPARLMHSGVARLGGGGDTSGLMHLLGQIAPVLGSTTRLVTRGMEFRNGNLELSVSAPDVPTLDSLRERLAALPGMKAELTAANPGANGVEGRIRLAGGGK